MLEPGGDLFARAWRGPVLESGKDLLELRRVEVDGAVLLGRGRGGEVGDGAPRRANILRAEALVDIEEGADGALPSHLCWAGGLSARCTRWAETSNSSRPQPQPSPPGKGQARGRLQRIGSLRPARTCAIQPPPASKTHPEQGSSSAQRNPVRRSAGGTRVRAPKTRGGPNWHAIGAEIQMFLSCGQSVVARLGSVRCGAFKTLNSSGAFTRVLAETRSPKQGQTYSGFHRSAISGGRIVRVIAVPPPGASAFVCARGARRCVGGQAWGARCVSRSGSRPERLATPHVRDCTMLALAGGSPVARALAVTPRLHMALRLGQIRPPLAGSLSGV